MRNFLYTDKFTINLDEVAFVSLEGDKLNIIFINNNVPLSLKYNNNEIAENQYIMIRENIQKRR